MSIPTGRSPSRANAALFLAVFGAATFSSRPSAEAQFPLSAEAFAEGAGRFLVDRAEQELGQFFTEFFVDRLCRDVTNTWQVTSKDLLPNTCRLLTQRRTVTLGLGVFRSALRRDFEELGHSLVVKLAERHRALPDATRGQDAQRVYLVAVLDLLQASAAVALENRDAATPLRDWSRISAHLVTNVPSDPTLQEFRPFWEAIEIALGDVTPVGAAGVPDPNAPAVLIQGTMVDFQSRINAVFTPPPAAPVPVAAPVAVAAVRNEIQLRLDQSTSNLAMHIGTLTQAANQSAGPERSREFVRSMLAVAADVASAACAEHCSDQVRRETIPNLVRVVSALVEGRFADALQSIADGNVLQELFELALASPNTTNRERSIEERRAWLERATELLALAADMATATSAEGVQSAIDAFAAPLGTWRGKHEISRFGLTLQGYAGVSIAVERTNDEWGTAISPSLSFGLQLHHSYGRRSRGRYFLYASIIDVGNVLSVRVDDFDNGANVHALPDVTWAQLFSPGLHLGTSLGRSPVDLLAGASWVPALRNAQGADHAALQIGLTLAVDVTIMRLY